jgi:hypothetical protein
MRIYERAEENHLSDFYCSTIARNSAEYLIMQGDAVAG